MTIDELRNHVIEAIREEPPQQGRTALWIDSASRFPERISHDMGDAEDKWIKEIWLPWVVRQKKALAIAAAWNEKESSEGAIKVEILSSNKREAFLLYRNISKKRRTTMLHAENRLFSNDVTEACRKIMRRNAMLDSSQ